MNLNRFCYLLLLLTAASSVLLAEPFAAWVTCVNLLTLVIYGTDKLAARRGWRRVPEATLLVFGFVGGWVGAIIGQQVFRHKTQKQPFRTYFAISVVLNVMILSVVIYELYQP
ncbi:MULTISPECIES: DUF1294 domain-containing protein [unclassified Escherichia]|uniref:DUF1294 domain-containing protein n=1 Tax=unclassified Escherichia TaxID=2608889 RepID=UPI0010299230|nr:MULTISPECIES: DUF1294 domain-containing protein [unclassified Escherichia]TGB63631.1 cyanate transporter [Escherichia coli]RZM93372.1 DUF1294 domain-containing protein [Escherichia sp. E14V5]RZN00436.1 DUF1294 domain-containing protein [Escherichia sp. E14V7]RZN16859.1 DUF1294 domain-containing protein [Escherichia sp. E14S1]RZN27031.1 DUF1294 domain-containing protein [Escherichia sp. E14V10]